MNKIKQVAKGRLPAVFTMRQPGLPRKWESMIHWEYLDFSSDEPSSYQFQCLGIWDTGATNTVISKNLADRENLNNGIIGYTRSHTANGTIDVPKCLLNFTLMSNSSILGPIELEVGIMDLPGVDALIGMDIIGRGELHQGYDINTNESILTFRYPPTRVFDFEQ